MSSQPDPPKSQSESKSKSRSEKPPTPQIPRSKFDDILDNTNPDELDQLERNILKAYKNARTLTHESVASHHGFKHSTTVNPAWTEHYGDWNAEQFNIDNQKKRDDGDKRRERDKMGRPARKSVGFSNTDDESTVPTTERTSRTSRTSNTADSSAFYDSGLGSSDVDEEDEKRDSLSSLIKSGHRTRQSSIASSTAPSRSQNTSTRNSSRTRSSHSTSRPSTSTHRSDTRRSTSRSTGYDTTTQPSTRAPRRRNMAPPPSDDSDYYAESDDDYDARTGKRRGTTLGRIGTDGREPAHIRRSPVTFNDNKSVKQFRSSDPPTTMRSTSPTNTRHTNWDPPPTTPDSDSQEFYEASEYTGKSGWTLGNAAKLAATGAALYGAWSVYQDPTLVSDYVNTDTLHHAKDLASGWYSNATAGMSDMVSGAASGLSSYGGSALNTLGTLGGAFGSTVGGVKDTIVSNVAETMTNAGPAWEVVKGYGSSMGGAVGSQLDKHRWLAPMATNVAMNGAKWFMDGRRQRAAETNGTMVQPSVRVGR